MKIFLDVYLDNNLGDDLMIMGLMDRFPNHTYYAVSEVPEVLKTYSNYTNVKFIAYKDKRKIAIECDVYITLGGSVFQFKSLKSLINRFRKISILKSAKRKGAKILTIGSNVGPFDIPLSTKALNMELKLNDYITVRDKYSYDYVKKVFDNVSYADDIVFEMLERENLMKKDSIGISTYTIMNDNEMNEKLKNAYLKFVDQCFVDDNDVKIYLFAFDTLNENDLECALFIKDNRPEYNITIVSYMGNKDEFLNIFKRCGKLLAMRFHSAILAEIYNIPYTPIAYSNKMSNYISDSYSRKCLDILDFIDNSITPSEFNDNLIELKYRCEYIKGHIELLNDFI